jgi:cyclase
MPTLRETQVADNVWVFTLGGDTLASSFGANCTAVAGREAVLLIDPLIAPAYARLVEAAVVERTDRPIRFVVLTHHHTDHALGAGWFAARGAVVVSHRACRERMALEHAGLIEERRAKPGIAELFHDAEAYLPSVVFEESVTLDLGGAEARVFHPGHGHAAGDAIVHLPFESVVVSGDLVSSGYHVNYEDAAVENLGRSLEFLRALEARVYVPGHGPPGGSDRIDAQARYHAAVRVAVSNAPDEAEMTARLRASYPDHLLDLVLPAAFPAWSRSCRPQGGP